MTEIIPYALYSPRQIANLKLIKTSRGNSRYHFVLDEIKNGRLPAINVGKGDVPYFRVRGQDIIEWNKKFNYYIG